LIVDKYADTLVLQSTTAGIEAQLDPILAALVDEYGPKAIVLRNDTASRELRGLTQETRVVRGEVTGPVVIEESGITYRVDVLEGQKTGFFFDQCENRQALQGLVRAGAPLTASVMSGPGPGAALRSLRGDRR
jgi:23S rRNA (cytosine1962-C5)-methyltransferase